MLLLFICTSYLADWRLLFGYWRGLRSWTSHSLRTIWVIITVSQFNILLCYDCWWMLEMLSCHLRLHLQSRQWLASSAGLTPFHWPGVKEQWAISLFPWKSQVLHLIVGKWMPSSPCSPTDIAIWRVLETIPISLQQLSKVDHSWPWTLSGKGHLTILIHGVAEQHTGSWRLV